jgi:hypothetical protein
MRFLDRFKATQVPKGTTVEDLCQVIQRQFSSYECKVKGKKLTVLHGKHGAEISVKGTHVQIHEWEPSLLSVRGIARTLNPIHDLKQDLGLTKGKKIADQIKGFLKTHYGQ